MPTLKMLCLLLAAPACLAAEPVEIAPDVAPAMRTLFETSHAQARRALAAMLPGLPLDAGRLRVRSTAAPTLEHGKDADGAMVLMLPPAPTPDAVPVVRALIAHATVHQAQGFAHKGSLGYYDWVVAREGGAEFLHMALQARLGWATAASLRDEMEAALNHCLSDMQDMSLGSFGQHGGGVRAYRCGLAVHLLALAALDEQGQDHARLLQRLRDHYRGDAQGDAAGFAHAIECGGEDARRDCTPRWLPRVFGEESLESVLLDMGGRRGSLLGVEPAWGPRLTARFALRHLAQLMRADCAGRVGIFEEPGALQIAPVRGCTVFREGMVVVAAEGRSLFASGGEALKTSLQACRQRGATVLGLRDGTRIEVKCNEEVALPARVFGVDPVRALGLAG